LPNKKLYFLHGFSGDPEDWSEMISYLPEYQCLSLSYPFELPSDGILIGYSMGGRIALHSPRPKIVISGHPGLQTLEEKNARILREHYWIQKLKTVSVSEFFDEWYAQPLFESLRNHPKFPSILKRRIQKSPQTLIQQIERHSLVHQPSQYSNTIFIHGEYDTTYRDLYEKFKIPSHEIPKAGHACHVENPEGVASQIKILITNFNNH
jgi:2-succinyl-6-hydroxy-2,4-cyclohexadiene-1-carboxylate synthase